MSLFSWLRHKNSPAVGGAEACTAMELPEGETGALDAKPAAAEIDAARLAEAVERLASDARLHQLSQWFTRHAREIADFQLAVTAIAAPPFGEQRRAEWLAEQLSALGLRMEQDEVGNVLAWREGASPREGAGTALSQARAAEEHAAIAISAHLDTVFPAGSALPVRRDNARLLGPGISDNGTGLAALWALARGMKECAITTSLPLLLVANVGEEGEGNLRGMRHLYRNEIARARSGKAAEFDLSAPRIAALVVLDGAGCESITGEALGSRRFEIVFRGPGGHSWSDFGAPNPITAAALAAAAMARILLPVEPRTTLNVGVIEGGTAVNAIPEEARMRVDIRSTEAAALEAMEEQLRRVVAEAREEAAALARRAGERLTAEIRLLDARPAGELREASPLLAAARAVDAQLGIRSQLLRASTDANIPLSLGLEALTLGAGGAGGGAHTLQEWFDPMHRELGLRRVGMLALLLAGLEEKSLEERR